MQNRNLGLKLQTRQKYVQNYYSQMGTTQSLSKQSKIQLSEQWKEMQKEDDFILYQHTITKNQCKAIKLVNVSFKDYKIYQKRLEYPCAFIPTIINYEGQLIKQKVQVSEQDSRYNVRVIVESTKYKLYQYSLDQLFQKQNALLKLQEVLQGYRFLSQQFGPFQVQENQIGWMANFKTKVWINSNYALNNKQTEKSTITQMIKSIFDIFAQFIPKKYWSIRFKSFDDAADFIKKFLQASVNKNENLRATYGSPSNQSQFDLVRKTVFSPNHSIKINFVNGISNETQPKVNQFFDSDKKNKQTQSFSQRLDQRVGPLYSTMPKKPIAINSINSLDKKNNNTFYANRQCFSIDSNRFGFALQSTEQLQTKSKKDESENSQKKNYQDKQVEYNFLDLQQRLTKSHRYKPYGKQELRDFNISMKSLIKSQKGKKEFFNPFIQQTRQPKQNNSFHSASKYNLNLNNSDSQSPEFSQQTNFKVPRRTVSKPDIKLFTPLNTNAFRNPSSEIKDMLRQKMRIKTQQTMCDSQPFDKLLTPKNEIKSSSDQKQNFPSQDKKTDNIIDVEDVLQDELEALFVEDNIEEQYEPEQIIEEIINEFTSFFDD